MFEARVVTPGQTGVNPTGTTIPIHDGDVQLDGTADVRSTLELTTIDTNLWPTGAGSLLAPYGNEVFVRRGIAFGSGTVEWVSLGYHRIDTSEQDDAPDGPIRVSARDRMAGIVDGRLTAPRPFPAATTRGALLTALVTEIYPWATIEWDDTAERDEAIGRQTIAEEDRYAVCNDVVTSAGKTWWWDHRGILVVRTPTPVGSPVWDVNHGENGVLVELGRRLTRSGAYNGVVATGEGADTAYPARAVAVDTNPNSPTFWGGPFGKVPYFYNSPLLTSVARARAAAATTLARMTGLPYAVDLTSVPNPALEPGDPIRVTYPGRTETHIIDRMTIPLTVEQPLSASTREQSTVLTGEA
ncbi:DUF5047 domain-containing protein [Micromonospora sp. MED01]|uniref:DUF5047 domain-containing protein n=1 Tax=Micromonospora alfalfae TaxID=2911212 RepID=UPI001EE8BFB4|nr:DUF5047 domain-containing protein [Micromonospora alfalfae]MCG5464236.1 DUF5047 domain-containing protein [Micromonospora alfalfae]